ncbi:beta-phosphoglucomutase [Leclercia adecarboxylata]|jgi:beta-phosphoglucomutase|uniref:beta-phosphoglucomutase n=1 Tax=Leclercia adecarboxylata TaxID=83655 RepID=UPI0022E511FE|nr:beta-phosphoglucomutase [Leclercia adecarboxylata]MDU6819984.1 beta-phosphoglucomutase [Leclercia adecarboxylata]WJT01388.1 beta-phosphoglucomutase [Leclercia adecarboxylata]
MMLKAVIFDLDGVITDTAHLHFLAWRTVAQEIGISIDETFNEALKGISRMDSLQRILRYGGKEGAFNEQQRLALAAKKNALYVRSLASLTQDSLLPGIREVLAGIRAANVKTGLASVSLNAPGILQALGIDHAFDFCADASRIARSKPDPEIFLAACAGLNVSPREAIGIEDAAAGIQAINAAGMLSVGIGPGLDEAGLQLHSTRELTWKCLTDFWASRTVLIRN